MPFVQRNKKGEITGLFSVRQKEGQEELPDDNPEVVQFRERHPVPPDFLRRRTPEEVEKFRRENEALEAEYKDLQNAVLAHSRAFAQLENALANLVYTVLNIQPKSSHLGQAVYFSPTSFDARIALVENVVLRYVEENNGLKDLPKHWEDVQKHLHAARRLRNAIAHGTAQRFLINDKTYVRLASPAFDVIRVWRDIANRQIPGLTADELSKAVGRLNRLETSIDDVQQVILAFREDDAATLQQRFLELEARLKTVNNP